MQTLFVCPRMRDLCVDWSIAERYARRVAIMRPIRGRGRYGHARRCSDTPPIFVKDVECAVLDPVPSLQNQKLSIRVLGSLPKSRSQPPHSPRPPGVFILRYL